MAAGTQISVEEYLSRTFRPDCDYIDGEVRERNLGEREHSGTQGAILIYLVTHYPQLKWRVLPEHRVQVKATRFRIPDVCVLAENAPREPIVRTPPELCIEILSKDDTRKDIRARIDDYFAMGVPVCWIIDPVVRKGWIATPGSETEATDGVLRAGDIEFVVAEVLEPIA